MLLELSEIEITKVVSTCFQLEPVDHGLTVGHADGVQELFLADAAIDEGRDDADLDEAQPSYDPLRPVHHEECDSLALLVTAAQEIVGHHVAVVLHL